jgi:hypothetical protein
MGTRNLTIVHQDCNYKVAQYCQWDGYPEGQGKIVLEALHQINLSDFREKVAKVNQVTTEQIEAYFDNDPPVDLHHFHRDCGGEIIELIASGKINEVYSSLEFASDSILCEWAYVIDLDVNTFEVYSGFNEYPLTDDDRFCFLQTNDSPYFPVKLIAKWSLLSLPTLEEFFGELKVKELV